MDPKIWDRHLQYSQMPPAYIISFPDYLSSYGGDSLAYGVPRVCGAALYSVVQSDCSILSHVLLSPGLHGNEVPKGIVLNLSSRSLIGSQSSKAVLIFVHGLSRSGYREDLS